MDNRGLRRKFESEGVMGLSIVVVDPREDLAAVLRSAVTGDDIRVVTCPDAAQAIRCCAGESVAVAVINGVCDEGDISIVEEIAARSPVTSTLLLGACLPDASPTAQSCEALASAWNHDSLLRAVEQGVIRYRLNSAVQAQDEPLLRSLARCMEVKDSGPPGHCDRVADYAQMIAEALNLSCALRKGIRLGSLLHDCGKLNVPERILSSNGPISSVDFAMVKKHPEWGIEVIAPSSPGETVRNVVLYHHERFDGNGYPAGFSGTDIPLEARVVAAADIFDALTCERPYRKAYHWEKAVKIISSMKGSILDPGIVEAFCDKIMLKYGINAM